MKKTILFVGLIALSLCSCGQKNREKMPEILQNHSGKENFTNLKNGNFKTVSLFNGKDLSGWYVFTEKYGVNNDVENQFQVQDGILHFDGEPMGYLCTENSYKNYYLKVVFRWGEKRYPPRENHKRDSGVLYHFANGETDWLWPKSVECQIQETDCGDYWLVGGTTAQSPNASTQEGTQGRFIRTENFENPNPEWNTIEVLCYDDKSEHYVNGHLVNQAYDLSVTEGRILLQLEGAEIFYKSVEMIALK